MTGTRLAETPAARHGKARAFVRINLQPYGLRKMRENHWTLEKSDGTIYHSQRLAANSYSCTCPDFKIRGLRCKHLGALMACGLMTSPRRVVIRKRVPLA